MNKEDLDYIVRVEKAIRQKYGEEAIQNPRAKWSEEKEREYLEQIKKIHKKQRKVEEAKDKVEVDGFLISKNYLVEIQKGVVQFARLIHSTRKMIYI